MKKILAFLMAAVLTLSLAACGGKGSNVSISDFEENIITMLNSEWSLDAVESDGGYTFRFADTLVALDFTLEGTANKDQMVEKVTATLDRVPENYFQEVSAQSLQEDIHDVMKVPVNRLSADFLISAFAIGASSFAGESLSETKTVDMLNFMLSALDAPQKKGGWTYSMDFTDRVLTITMEFTG